MTSVIIPSRKSENLKACLNALSHYDYSAPLRIFVVDDGLPVRPLGHGPGPGPRYILGANPFVFARNCNLGIRAAGDDDVILLNDDALLTTPNGFSRLIEAGLAHPEYGVIAAASNNTGNPNQKPRGLGLRTEIKMVCFVCVFISRKTLKAVGLLDERFTDYSHDDDDYCLRAKRAGLKIGIFDGCVMDHASLTSTYRETGPRDMEHNRHIFVQKWGRNAWAH